MDTRSLDYGSFDIFLNGLNREPYILIFVNWLYKGQPRIARLNTDVILAYRSLTMPQTAFEQ